MAVSSISPLINDSTNASTAASTYAEKVTILHLGVKFTYQILSFSVVSIDLRKAKIQMFMEESGSVLLCDGFIRADRELDERATPFFIKLQEHYLVPVEEVAKEVPSMATLSPLPNKEFLVIWQWEWAEDMYDGTDSANTEESLQQAGDLSTDSDLTDADDDMLDTVCCKCVGVTRDLSYQQALEAAYKQLQEGIDVNVKLAPEPNNPYDSRAISFQCLVNKSWKTIGYVIRELCDCIHDAITKHSIVEVKLSWVKYKVIRTTGLGYYAAVSITRKGQMHTSVRTQ